MLYSEREISTERPTVQLFIPDSRPSTPPYSQLLYNVLLQVSASFIESRNITKCIRCACKSLCQTANPWRSNTEYMKEDRTIRDFANSSFRWLS